MLPYLALDNQIHIARCGAEPSTYLGLSHALCSESANFKHLRFGELGLSSLFATRLSALLHLVLHVVVIRAKKQMVRVDTSAHIAAMTDEHAVRDGAVMDYPREAMGAFFGAVPAADMNNAIPMTVATCPQPTAIGLLDMRPETFGKRKQVGASSMTLNKLVRLSLNVALLGVVLDGNVGFLPTTAVAVPVGDFVLRHKNTSCRMTEHALAEGAGRRQEARNNYSFAQCFRQLTITLSKCKYTIIGAFQQRLSSLQGV